MIGLIDYGVGNINAFLNIYKQLGVEARKVSNSDEISDFSKLILSQVFKQEKINFCPLSNAIFDKEIPILF